MYKRKMSQPEELKPIEPKPIEPEIIKANIPTTPQIANVLPTEEQVKQIIEMVQDQMAKSADKQTNSEVETPPSNTTVPTTDKQPNSEVETPLSNTTVTPTDTTALNAEEAPPAAAATPTSKELAAAEQAVTDAESKLNDAYDADKAAAQTALDAAKAKLAELKATTTTGGRRRSTRRRQKKSGKKSRRQSKKGGKKHRKRTSKKGGKSKKRSQRKH